MSRLENRAGRRRSEIMNEMELRAAVQAFVHGVAYGRGLAHPVEVVEVGPLQVMRDCPPLRRYRRKEHFTICETDPDVAIAAVRAYGPTYWGLNVFERPDADHIDTQNAYKAAGYRLNVRLPLYAFDLKELGRAEPRQGVMRVETPIQADAVTQAAGHRQIRSEHLKDGDSLIRLYGAFVGPAAVGWVQSVTATDDSRWVSNLHVVEAERRKGLGGALMNAMMADDLKYGYRFSVLTASKEGSMLYDVLGYKRVALLQVFTPVKSKR